MSSSIPANSVTVVVTQGRMTGRRSSISFHLSIQHDAVKLTREIDFSNVNLFGKLLGEFGSLHSHFFLVLEPLQHRSESMSGTRRVT